MSKIFADVGGTTTANDGLTLDKWMQRLTVRFMSAPESLLRAELLDTIREFFKESNAWREQIGPYDIFANNDLIWLNPVDAYSEAVYVKRVWVQEEGKTPSFLQPLTMRYTEGTVNTPTNYSLPDPYVIRLWPMPAVTMKSVLWVDAILCPLPDATRLPNIAMSHHFDAILYGAFARILAIPNKPWTDLMLSMRMSQIFRRDITRLRSQSDQGYTNADPGWKFPAFA